MLRKSTTIEFYRPTCQLKDIVLSQWFESACCMCILVNAAVLARAADYAAQNLDSPTTSELEALEKGFAAFYLVELTLRLMVHRKLFFCGADWR